MKVVFLFCFIILLNACARNIFQNGNSSQTDLQSAENQKISLKDLLKEKEIENAQKFKQELKQRQKKEIAELSRNCQLSILEKAVTGKEDLEVRVWRNSAWSKSWTFILKRSGGEWSADFQSQIFEEGTNKLKKISKRKLTEPKSGWENFWRRLEDKRILTLPDGFENGGDDPCPDCGTFIIETSIGGDYRFYLYTEPTLQSEIPEVRQVAEIANTIAGEFSLKEFDTSEP